MGVTGARGPTPCEGRPRGGHGTIPAGLRRRCARLPSFASEVRRELAAGTAAGHGRTDRPELAGLIDAAGVWDADGVTFRTPSAAVARSVVRLWRSEFGLESRLSPSDTDRFGRARYAVRTRGNGAIQAAAEELALGARLPLRGGPDGLPEGRIPGRGLGDPPRRPRRVPPRVRAPRRSVRQARCAEFSRAPLAVVRRRGRWVAYTKSADGVTTLLAQMGLHDAVLEYEARAVLGEAKANANRVTNFDAANAGRTATAAARQQSALEELDPSSSPRPERDAGASPRQPRRLPGRTRPPRGPLQERREPPPEAAFQSLPACQPAPADASPQPKQAARCAAIGVGERLSRADRGDRRARTGRQKAGSEGHGRPQRAESEPC